VAREEKKQEIDALKELFSSCTSAVFTDYRGLSSKEITDLRRKLRQNKVGYRVVKNTLARIALAEVDKEYLEEFFNGPVAVAYGRNELNEPAKAILEFVQKNKLELEVTGGFADGRKLTKAEVIIISRLPSREVLLSQILAGMQSPISRLVSTLNGPIRGFARLLQARAEQLEGE